MTTQEALFARDGAIAIVEANADPAWKEEALEAVIRVASIKTTFTTDDVWDELSDEANTHEPRAMGAVMKRAQREGFIAPLNEHVLSSRRACHARPVRVWRSLSL